MSLRTTLRSGAALGALLLLAACQVAVTPAPAGQPSPGATAAASALPTVAPSAAPSSQPSASPSASAAPSAAPSPGGTKVAFEKLLYQPGPPEDGKPLPETRNQRLKTQAELDALLDKIEAEETGRPTVDFTKKEVLAFYDEGGPSGCHELQLLELLDQGTTLQPKFAEKPKPGDDRICTAVFIYPKFLLVAIDKTTDKVAGID